MCCKYNCLVAVLAFSLSATLLHGQQLSRHALVVVKAPPAAELYIGKTPTKLTGAERAFLTPALAPGKDFEYELTAVWTDEGEVRKATQVVLVRAGGRTEVDLTRPTEQAKPKERNFLFNYEATIKDLPQGKKVRVWLPMPASSTVQDIQVEQIDVPGKESIGTEKQYGNRVLYFEAEADKAGKIPVKVVYRVVRREVKTDPETGKAMAPLAGERIARFLEADKMVPIGGKSLSILKDKLPKEQVSIGKIAYEAVNNHMRYDKSGTGWGRGDSEWACDSKYGNCTDFHSLFMSIVRSQKIPSKFEIGFPLPPERGSGKIGGYHCWAWFLPDGKGWVPVDISEANRHPDMRDYYFGNLTEDRVTFSTGRDLELTPPQDGPPLNFFVYPYVEVDGQPYPLENIVRTYTYQDTPR